MRPVVAVCVNNDASRHVDHVYNSVVAHSGWVDFHVVAHPNVPKDIVQHFKDSGYVVHLRGVWPEMNTNSLRCRCPLRTQAVYYRWLLPDLLATHRVIYMDHDAVVLGDIRELWEIDLGDSYAAMARDPFNETIRDTWNFFASHAPKAGVNMDAVALQSGLMVINSELWRRDRIKDQLVGLFNENPMNDQLAVSILFDGRVLLLNKNWSVPVRYCDDDLFCSKTGVRYEQPKFLHWHGPGKPWKDDVPFKAVYEGYS